MSRFHSKRRNTAAERSPLRRSPFLAKLGRFMILTLLVLVVLELFVFNYKSFLLMGDRHEQKTISSMEIYTLNLTLDQEGENMFTATAKDPVIEFRNIGVAPKTLKLNAAFQRQTRMRMDFDVSFSDEAHSNLWENENIGSIIRGVERSQFVTCSYSGKAETIRFTLHIDKGEQIQIDSLSVNEKIPMHLSLTRVLILLAIVSAIYFVVKCPSLQQAYSGKSARHAWAVAGTIGAFLIILLVIYIIYVGNPLRYGNRAILDQLSKELVDAFRHGQLSLLDKPSDELLALDDPYDRYARSGIPNKWDHLLYNGKYYSYYGIAPVLTLFLPFNLITGQYLPSMTACMIFAIIGVVFLSLAYIEVIKRWFSKTPASLVVCGLFMLLCSSGVIFCTFRPKFYEAAELSAFMYFAVGLYCMLRSNVFTKQRIKLSKLCLSAVFVSLAVLSRPTFALYAVVMLVFVAYALHQYRKAEDAPVKKGRYILRFLLAALLPYAIFGLVQIVYNYLRFGSPLEFGIQYSLTIHNFTKTEFHPSLAWVSIYNFLFNLPGLSSSFPFIDCHNEMFSVNGYYFFENTQVPMTFGLVWRALPVLALLYAPHVLKTLDKPNRRRALLIGGLGGLLIPLVILASTWESGHAMRYNIDFGWQMLFPALMIIFYTYNRITNERLRQILKNLFIVCTVLCVLANLAVVFTQWPRGENTFNSYPSLEIGYHKFKMLFEFWN